MQFTEATNGRTFVLRLEQGEIIHEVVEAFAKEQSLSRAVLWVIGGADRGSQLVTGPRYPGSDPTSPSMPLHTYILDGIHEAEGVGTLFPDENGTPILHMHLSCGRDSRSSTGCARNGVLVWLYMEVVIMELTGIDSMRSPDPATGLNLLSP